jgi:hypothetical protein
LRALELLATHGLHGIAEDGFDVSEFGGHGWKSMREVVGLVA